MAPNNTLGMTIQTKMHDPYGETKFYQTELKHTEPYEEVSPNRTPLINRINEMQGESLHGTAITVIPEISLVQSSNEKVMERKSAEIDM